MLRCTLLSILLLLIGCGPDGDSEDNRVCIVNDAFNQSTDGSQLQEQAEEANLSSSPDNQNDGEVVICGTSVDVEAAIQNINGDSEELSEFLARGTRL